MKKNVSLEIILEKSAKLDLPQHVLCFWETGFPQNQAIRKRASALSSGSSRPQAHETVHVLMRR